MARPTKPARDARRNAHLPRFISVYGVLLVSMGSAIAVFHGLTWMLSPDWPVVRYVLAWDVGSLVYLGFALAAIMRFDIRKARKRASDQDEGAILVLIFAVIAAAVSFAAIVELLGAIKDSDPQRGFYFTLAAMTILISWILIHVMFAFHYSHEFYGGDDLGRGGGLKFPGNLPQPDYWDFIYFSFVIGMTFQVSDVQVTGKRMRRLVVAHGAAAFFFSVAILALAVNIGSQLISG